MKPIIISPSLLSADFSQLNNEIKTVADSGAKWLHFDVMDGHFVPNISFGSVVLKAIKPLSNLVMDVHLMISEPRRYASDFIKAGADFITFHYESFAEVEERLDCIEFLKNQGVKVGMSIRPNTPVEQIIPYLTQLDMVLIMSVEPGFGGQSFQESSLVKIKGLRQVIDVLKIPCLIQVDGGINQDSATRCRMAGADVLVAGSYLFGHDDFSHRVALLQGAE